MFSHAKDLLIEAIGGPKGQCELLRKILIAATEAERVGEEWIAHVSEQHKKLLDREAR